MLSGGHAIVVDFGIAKAVGDARERGRSRATGSSLGTPAYMAPEQAAGDENVDHRADIYAVGAVLFEMVEGSPAFAGTWQQVMMDKMARDAPSLASRANRVARPHRLVARCLSRDVADASGQRRRIARRRFAACRDQIAPRATGGARGDRRRGGTRCEALRVRVHSRSPLAMGTRDRDSDHSAHDGSRPAGLGLRRRHARRRASAKGLDARRADGTTWTQRQTFLSEPSGADRDARLARRHDALDAGRHDAHRRGPDSAQRVVLPLLEAWLPPSDDHGRADRRQLRADPQPDPLRRLTDPDSDMVLLPRPCSSPRSTDFRAAPLELSDFLMDRLEITNRQYKAFVDAGGYTTREWWDSTIVRERRADRVEDVAMKLFVDRAGRPGPSTWEGGAPVDSTGDLPVGGVSWYEARAYARFARKELPTVFEWNAAAIPDAARWLVVKRPLRVDESGAWRERRESVGPRGVYDMAGNVREWTENAREPRRAATSWAADGAIRSTSSPRCMRSPTRPLGDQRDSPRTAAGLERDLAAARASDWRSGDFSAVRPVDDATFRGFLTQYDYDRTPLNASVVDARHDAARLGSRRHRVRHPAATRECPPCSFCPSV